MDVSAARLAQSAERKALNLVVVGSSPTVGDLLVKPRTQGALSQRKDILGGPGISFPKKRYPQGYREGPGISLPEERYPWGGGGARDIFPREKISLGGPRDIFPREKISLAGPGISYPEKRYPWGGARHILPRERYPWEGRGIFFPEKRYP